MEHLLNMPQFTQLCKTGFMTRQTEMGRADLQFYSVDMLELCNGNTIEKILFNEKYKFRINNISNDDIKEIIKRSPIYSNLVDKLI